MKPTPEELIEEKDSVLMIMTEESYQKLQYQWPTDDLPLYRFQVLKDDVKRVIKTLKPY